MKQKISILASILLFSAACSTADKYDFVPVNKRPAPVADKVQEWQPFTPQEKPTPPAAARTGSWLGKSAWKYPPAPVPTSSQGPLISPSDLAEPLEPFAAAPTTDVVRALLPSDQSEKQDSTPAEGTAWVDRHVPAAARDGFQKAAKEAAMLGTSEFVDEETEGHFAINRVWKAGKCVGLEVILLSPGGKLPIISRGNTEVCS